MEALSKNSYPIGRILLGVLFVMGGFGKITMMGAPAFGGFIESQIPGLGFLAWPVMLYELLAGLAIIVGFKTRLVALSLAVFCVFTGVIYHGSADMNGMLKNVALAGGYLLLFAKGAGHWAIDKE